MYPKVTLCVLSYNTGKYAELAIRSAISCGYPNLEIVCVDDCSTDDSADILTKLSKSIPFRFFRNENNLGIPGACNRGLSFSTGEYFIVLGDDLLLPNRIWGDVEILERHPDVGLVCGMAKAIGPDGLELEKYAKWQNSQKEGLFQEAPESVWLRGSRIFTPTVTYRTRVLRDAGGWETFFDFEDRPMFMRLAQDGIKGWHRSEVTTLYRRHGKNFSGSFRVGMLKQELELKRRFGLSIPSWKVTSKLLIEVHYWMLFLKTSSSEARESLSLADLSRWNWTLESRALKLTFLCLTFLRPNRLATRGIRQYLFPRRGI